MSRRRHPETGEPSVSYERQVTAVRAARLARFFDSTFNALLNPEFSDAEASNWTVTVNRLWATAESMDFPSIARWRLIDLLEVASLAYDQNEIDRDTVSNVAGWILLKYATEFPVNARALKSSDLIPAILAPRRKRGRPRGSMRLKSKGEKRPDRWAAYHAVCKAAGLAPPDVASLRVQYARWKRAEK